MKNIRERAILIKAKLSDSNCIKHSRISKMYDLVEMDFSEVSFFKTNAKMACLLTAQLILIDLTRDSDLAYKKLDELEKVNYHAKKIVIYNDAKVWRECQHAESAHVIGLNDQSCAEKMEKVLLELEEKKTWIGKLKKHFLGDLTSEEN